MLGDFNVVRDVSERVRSTPPTLSDILYFNSWLLNCGVDDVNGSGCELTWKNKQDISTLVWSKHNRALANTAWINKFPATSANFLPSGVSDHSPVLVTVFADKYHGARFSFLNCWVNHPDYHSLVKESWLEPFTRCHIYKLFARLKNVKKKLAQMHKENFSKISQWIKLCKENLFDCQMKIQQNVHSPELYDKEKDLLHNYIALRKAEENILRQKYFFARIHERKQQQILGQIKDKDGLGRAGLDDVASSFVDYYKSLLGSSLAISPIDDQYIQQSPCVKDADSLVLLRPFEAAEIKNAVFRIGPDKSLGSDGFSSEFFKASWDLVGPDFCKAVQAYFRNGRLNKQANATLIALIPKKKNLYKCYGF
ncbi:uncharacterized protein LOC141614095 [Silene latifolia]|uniref:uncharacterized protein LOC141614095 n=1 Tax=Silene latifolia TaxID=37657 RepID=UPI003D775213